MPNDRSDRLKALQEYEQHRGERLAIVYVTSTRPGLEVQMADDVLRPLYEHLCAAPDRAKKGVDVIVHSNGGHGTVPWRMTSLIREFTDDFTVVVPHKAFSAATLLALGANNILMHRMGCLGPIDPSVANAFNPTHPQNPGQQIPISVEDVSAFFKHVKEEVGITHEDELVQALLSLTKNIHPLALGNVQRSHNQSRMMATKLLKTHVAADRDHEITQIIDNLKSNLFFHGHPINRREAKDDLKLNVISADGPLEESLWRLYVQYEDLLQLNERFDPASEYAKRQPATPPAQLDTAQIVQQMAQLAANGIGIGAVSPQQLVDLAAAMLPHVAGTTTRKPVELNDMVGVCLESRARSDFHKVDARIERVATMTPAGPQDGFRTEVLNQRWEVET